MASFVADRKDQLATDKRPKKSKDNSTALENQCVNPNIELRCKRTGQYENRLVLNQYEQ